jgi:hypothetical protein
MVKYLIYVFFGDLLECNYRVESHIKLEIFDKL